MKIKINDEIETIDAELTVSELLKVKNVKMPQMVSVELNHQILKHSELNTKILHDNDEINFLYFMGGGK